MVAKVTAHSSKDASGVEVDSEEEIRSRRGIYGSFEEDDDDDEYLEQVAASPIPRRRARTTRTPVEGSPGVVLQVGRSLRSTWGGQ